MSTATEKAITVTKLDRPTNRLPAEPLIESEEDVNKALEELAFIEAHTASASNACDVKIAQLREALEQELGTTLGADEFIPYAQRSASLKAALRQYVESERPELKTANGSKSAEYRHGVLSWVKSRDSVVYAKGITHAKAVEAIDESTASIRSNAGGLKQRLAELASALRLFARDRKGRALDLFVDFQAKISLKRVGDAIKEKKLRPDEAKQWGLIFKKGQDEFVVKPHQYEASRR